FAVGVAEAHLVVDGGEPGEEVEVPTRSRREVKLRRQAERARLPLERAVGELAVESVERELEPEEPADSPPDQEPTAAHTDALCARGVGRVDPHAGGAEAEAPLVGVGSGGGKNERAENEGLHAGPSLQAACRANHPKSCVGFRYTVAESYRVVIKAALASKRRRG